MIDLSNYYRAQVYKDSVTGRDNTSYYWIQKKDSETGRITENIYDVKKDRFVLFDWVDEAGHGLIKGDHVNLIIRNRINEQITEYFYNKVDVTDGEFLYDKWLTGDEWLEVLKKRDIIV